jgi:Uri superfamily endonuclease
MALSNIFTSLIIQMGMSGGIADMSKFNTDFRSGVYLYSGNPVNARVAKHFGVPAHDLGLYLMGEQ